MSARDWRTLLLSASVITDMRISTVKDEKGTQLFFGDLGKAGMLGMVPGTRMNH